MKQFAVNYKKSSVFQTRIIKAESAEIATAYFQSIEPTAEVCGAWEDSTDYSRRGMPTVTVPEGWTDTEEENTISLENKIELLKEMRETAKYLQDVYKKEGKKKKSSDNFHEWMAFDIAIRILESDKTARKMSACYGIAV